MVYSFSKLVFWPLLSLFIKKIDGIENLPKKPFIIAANHSSYIDGVILIFLLAWHRNMQLCTFATNEKFLGSFWNMVFNHFGAIRINGSIEKARTALKQGRCIGVFPEGQRTFTGDVQKVTHTGLGVLALLNKVPVVPVGLNTWHFWNRYRAMPNFRKDIVITIGKPMTFKQKPTKQNFGKVTQMVMKEVKRIARISHS
jgi:1-acyl-sn-glycerol-3-phosphate acyltransferase